MTYDIVNSIPDSILHLPTALHEEEFQSLRPTLAQLVAKLR